GKRKVRSQRKTFEQFVNPDDRRYREVSQRAPLRAQLAFPCVLPRVRNRPHALTRPLAGRWVSSSVRKVIYHLGGKPLTSTPVMILISNENTAQSATQTCGTANAREERVACRDGGRSV